MTDYKKIGMQALEYVVGGIITVAGGNWVVPYVNKITFISQAAIPLINMSVHQVVAYGAGFGVAYWGCKKYFDKSA